MDNNKRPIAYSLIIAAALLFLAGCGINGLLDHASERAKSVISDYFGEETAAPSGEFSSTPDFSSSAVPPPAFSQSPAPDGEGVPAETQAAVPAPENAGLLYCRSLLTGDALEDYDRITAGLAGLDEVISGIASDPDTVSRLVSYVFMDHPEFFWFTGGGTTTTHTLGGAVTGRDLTPEYAMTKEEAAAAQALIDEKTAAFLATVPETASDYDKALAVYDYIIDNTDYDLDVAGNSIYNVFILGRGVCGCYSMATQYLLNRLGIPCVMVSGYGQDGTHAWNLVKLEGDWYWLDATWGDPLFMGGSQMAGYISYDYFCVTTQELLRTHRLDGSLPVPECTATACNYYVKNGLLLDSYDYDAVLDIVLRTAQAGGATAVFKLASKDAYDAAVADLIEGGALPDLFLDARNLGYTGLRTVGTFTYSLDDDQRTLMLAMPY